MRTKRALPVVLLAVLGCALVARAEDSREVVLETSERLSVAEINRRTSELEDARKRIDAARAQLDADVAAIVSEIRARHALTASETFRLHPQDPGRIVVTIAPVRS